jgi:hypothetical protein
MRLPAVSRCSVANVALLAFPACVVGDAPCPPMSSRFDPSEQGVTTADDYESVECAPLGLPVGGNRTILVQCTESWCSPGYSGIYCVSTESIVAWLDTVTVDYKCVGGHGGRQVCYVGCEDCDGWCDA